MVVGTNHGRRLSFMLVFIVIFGLTEVVGVTPSETTFYYGTY